MSAHSIPDDDYPHSLSTECGCGPMRVWAVFDGRTRFVFAHADGRLCNEINPATGDRCVNDAGCAGLPHRHPWGERGVIEWSSCPPDDPAAGYSTAPSSTGRSLAPR